MLVVLGGLPGVGKTTIARELAVTLKAVYVRIDTIEHALRTAGVQVEGEGYSVAYGVAEDNLRLGQIVIADCVNPWTLTRHAWRSVANRAGVRLVQVEIVCSNVEEHRRRVDSRVSDIPGHRLPTWEDVMTRDYHAWERDRLVVDTAGRDVRQSVRRVLELIPLRG